MAISDAGSEILNRAPGEIRIRRWGAVGLVLLTTMAVGSISFWLVPPYWLIMAWLLAPPGGWRSSAEPARDSEATAVEPAMEDEAPPPDEPPAADETLTPTKPARRKRSRSKKKVQDESPTPNVEATWVRVGPNQFVRVEVPVEPEPEPEPASAESNLSGESAANPAVAEPAVDESDRLSVGDVSTPTEPLRDSPPPILPEHPEPRATKPERPAEQVERRFDAARWQARSWRPEGGAQGLGPSSRLRIGLRRNVTIAGEFSHAPADRFSRV
jgi:hypothetical protein